MRFALAATTLAAMLAASLSAVPQQVSCKSMPGMDMASPATPPEKLPAPIAMSGIGNGSIIITTTSPDARIWFTQGLNLLHDFWDYESSRAFEQGIRADPKCAMCYWGLYQAESFRGEDDAWAHAALQQAEKLAGHASPSEKLYIEAAKQQSNAHLAAKKDAKKKKPGMWSVEGTATAHIDSKETKVFRKLVSKNPDDVQAKIFLAESLTDGFDKDARPKPGTAEAQAILASILAAHPDDTAANHYWIHAQEPGLHPESALPSARMLGPVTYASGHMVHMPGHIFYRTGDYETGRLSFLASMHTDESYMQTQHVAVDDDWNYVHNLMYLIADLLEAGRLEEATLTSAKLNAARGTRDTTLYRFSARDGTTRLDPLLPVALRSADWPRAIALLNAGKPAADLKNLTELRDALLDYTRGMAALSANDTSSLSAAERFSKSLDDLTAKPSSTPPGKTAGAMPSMPGMASSKDAMAGPIHSFLNVAALELRASVLLAQGKTADADTAFTKAADAEHALGYHEPPNYIRPVGETRGDALLRAHRYADARAAYQAALAERPNSGFPLFGIAQADAAAGNKAAATADFHALTDAWQHADSDLPQLSAAREWLTTQTVVATR